jgi:thiamine kinase-like enzyme
MKTIQKISWNDINSSIGTLIETSGGYTTAQRGIITLPNQEKLFVKIGHDDLTKQWAHKEIQVYRFLQKYNFPFIPGLLAVNNEETAFALEPLQTGWGWTDNWTIERLDKTLEAMDDLAEIVPDDQDKLLFEKSFISETANGWRPLSEDSELQRVLHAKLIAANRQDLANGINFTEHAQRSLKFMFERTALVHNDVRADNCAWSEELKTVKLIDWNWAQLGDRRIDVGAFLVHVHKTGFVITNHLHRLDKEALHWLAGFWFKSATQPILDGSSERAALRGYQLASGVTAFDLAQSL